MNPKYLLNPFEKVAGWTSLLVGLAAILVAGMVGSFSNTQFDGILNVHSAMDSVWYKFVSQPVLSVGVVALWFVLFAKIFGKSSVRAIDVVGTQCFAFLPLAPVSTLGFFHIVQEMNVKLQAFAANPGTSLGVEPLQMTAFVVLMLVVMLLTVWSAIWIYKGLKVAANLPDSIHIPVYISGLIVGMIVPKVLISFIF